MVVVPCTPSSWPSPLGAVSSAAPEGSLVVAWVLVALVLGVVLVLVLVVLALMLVLVLVVVLVVLDAMAGQWPG